jgi:hypothetical protein
MREAIRVWLSTAPVTYVGDHVYYARFNGTNGNRKSRHTPGIYGDTGDQHHCMDGDDNPHIEI